MSSNTRFWLILIGIFLVGRVCGQPCGNDSPFGIDSSKDLCAVEGDSTCVSFLIYHNPTTQNGTYLVEFPDGTSQTIENVSQVVAVEKKYWFDCENMPGDYIEPGMNENASGAFGYEVTVTRMDCVNEYNQFVEGIFEFNIVPNPLNGFEYSDTDCVSSFTVEFTEDICRYELVDEYFWYVDGDLVADSLSFVYTFPGPGNYDVTFAVTDYFECDTFRVQRTIPITASPSANAILQIDSTQLCSSTFNIGINNISQYADTFTWTATSAGVSFSDETAENPIITITNPQASSYTFDLCATNSDCGQDCRSFTVTTFDQQMVSLLPETVLCTQTTVNTCNFMEFAPSPSNVVWSSPDAIVTNNPFDSCAIVQIPNADNFTIVAEGKDICGNDFSEAVTIPLTPSPEVTLSLPDSICESSDLINLLDYVTPADYIESCDVPNCEFIPNNSGTYTFTLTDSCGGTYPMQTAVIPIGGLTQSEITICVGEAIDLEASIQQGAYTGDNVVNGIFQSNDVGTFDLQYTDPTSFCMGIAPFTVNVVAEPIASFAFQNTSCLAGENVFLEGNNITINNTSATPIISYTVDGIDFNFYEENVENITLTNLAPGNYTVTQVVGISAECQAPISSTFTIEAIYQPNINIAIDTTSACDSIQIDLTVNPSVEGYEYDWSLEGETSNNEVFSVMVERPSIADTLTANLTVMTACTTITGMVEIVRPARFDTSFEITNTNDAICSGDTATLVNTSQNYDAISVIFEDGTTSNTFPETLVYFNNTDTTRYIPIIVEGFKDGCPPDRAVDTLVVYPVNTDASFSVDYGTPACSPFTITLTTAVTPVEAVTRIDWGDGSTPQLIDNLTDTTYTYPFFVTDTTLTLNVTSELCGEDSQSEDLNIFASPNMAIGFQTPSGQCISDTIEFMALGDVLPTYDVDWDFGDGTFSNFLNPQKRYTNAGIYEVMLTVTDTNLCQSIDSITVEVKDYTGEEFVIDAPGTICENGNFELNVLNTFNDISIDYGNDVLSNEPLPYPYAAAGNYNLTITATDLNGCQQDTSLWVEVVPPFSVNIIPDVDEQVIEFGTSIILDFMVNPNRAVTHVWTGEGIDNPDNRQITVTPLKDTIYHLVALDEFGCTAEDDIFIRVQKAYCEGIYVPNIFSPNEDFMNDLFFINANPNIVQAVKSFQIFDRWGEQVFEANNCTPDGLGCSWDGTLKGEKLNPAVFVWRAEVAFKDGRVEICRGDVTLVY